MRLEIRDLESSMVYDISSEGAVMGRERAKTDISFRDESISKRHARIYHEQGHWYLEDLGSSNGTYLDDQRVNGPVMLSQGAIFSLAQKRFEVVFADNGATNGASAVDDFPPLGVPSARSAGELPPPAGESMDNRFEPSGDEGEEVEAKGFGYFFIAVPKAIAYYLAAVPLMALNPLGTIRKGIEDQKLPAMGKMELIAYAIPAFVITSLVGSIVAAIVTMINVGIGAGFVALLTAWIGPLIAVVIAAVVGFIFHPVMGWLIKFLKGESNAKSRTNFGIMSWTLAILAAVPPNVGLLFLLIPLPFMGVIPAVLGVVVSLIYFVFYTRWFKFFNVVKWFQIVVTVLLGLGILGSAWGVISAILNPGSIGGGSTTVAAVDTTGMTDEQKEAVEKAQKMAAEAAAATGDATDMQAKAEEAAAKALQNRDPKAVAEAAKVAEDSAKAAQKTGVEAVAKTAAAAEAAKVAAKETEKEEAEEAAPPPPPPLTKKEELAAAKAEKAAAAEKEEAEEAAPPPPPPPRAPAVPVNLNGKLEDDPIVRAKLATPFAEFLRKRDAIEAAIDANPKWVKDKRIKTDYEALWTKTFKVRDKWGKKKGEAWKKAKVLNRLKDQEVYEETHEHVDIVYNVIFGQ